MTSQNRRPTMKDNQAKYPQLRFKGFTDPWEQRKLSDLTESHNSGVYIPKDQYGEGTNIIGVGDIYDSDVVDGQRYRLAPVKDKRFILHTNDLLYGESSLVPEGIARVVSVSEAGAGTAFAWHTRRFKVNQVTLNSRFLGLELDYWLPARSHLMRSSTKTALTGITTQDFFNTQIVFPSKPEQEKIATLINSLDTAIALHQRKLAKLKELKQGYLQKMFPQNGSKFPQLRFAGFADAWEERKLIDVAQFNPKTVLPDEFEYVDLESVIGTEMISHRTESKDQAPSRAQRLAKKGDVFYQTVRPYQMNNYLYDLPYDNYVFSTGYAQMRPNIDSYFLLNGVQNKQFVQHVLDRSTGTSYPAINSSDLSNIEINVPSKLAEQQKIGSFFKQVDNTIALHQRKLEKLQELKKGYLQKMFC